MLLQVVNLFGLLLHDGKYLFVYRHHRVVRNKRHKAEVALALAQTLRGGGLVPDVLEGIQEGIQGEIDGAIEGETAAATGDTAGDEVAIETIKTTNVL